MSETVKKDFPEGMAIKPNVHRYLQSLSNPTEMMHTLKNELTGKKRPPIFFSPERQMHVLSRSGNPKDPKVIIANSGCFEYNSPSKYTGTLQGNDHPEVVDADRGDGPLMYAFTIPDDEFVVSQGEKDVLQVLVKIKESFAAIGIDLAYNITTVDNLTNWMQENRPNEAGYHVLSPRALSSYAQKEEREVFENQALLHATLYSKRGFQEYCLENDVPTPNTLYHLFKESQISRIAYEIQSELTNVNNWVVTRDEGVGGSGVHKGISLEDLPNVLKAHFQEGETIMTQRQLPLLGGMSPCARYYIGEDGIHFMGVTDQRFLDKEGTKYGGNMWFRGIEEEIEKIAPGFREINDKAAVILYKSGFRGVNNLDTLIIAQEDAARLGESGQVLLREHNGRPAMSAIMSRIQEGKINELPVDRIHSKTKIIISDDIFNNPSFISVLNSIHKDVRVIVGTRYQDSGETYLLFAANKNVSREELNDIEKIVIQTVQQTQI
jgi:hypothetical protein